MPVVTQEMAFARAVADRVVFIDAGRIVEIAPRMSTSPRRSRNVRGVSWTSWCFRKPPPKTTFSSYDVLH